METMSLTDPKSNRISSEVHPAIHTGARREPPGRLGSRGWWIVVLGFAAFLIGCVVYALLAD